MDPPSQTNEMAAEPKIHAGNPQDTSFFDLASSVPRRGFPSTSVGKEDQTEQASFNPLLDIQPEDALGQFSYAPATQTTVVTTTTTTTTKFPPLRMKAPQHLHDLDPKQYPLATSPTPTSLRELHFKLNGRPMVFQEASDTLETVEKLDDDNKNLAESNGTLSSIAQVRLRMQTPSQDQLQPRKSSTRKPRQTSDDTVITRRKRAMSPVSVSITENTPATGHDGSRKKRMVSTGKPSLSREPPALRTSHSRLNLVQTSTPVTPYIDRGNGHSRKVTGQRSKTPQDYDQEDLVELESNGTGSTFDLLEGSPDEPQILSPRSEITHGISSRKRDESATLDDSKANNSVADLDAGSSVTPRLENDEMSFPQFRQPVRPRPTVLTTTAAQDGSLPSPSLSPVTAAANIQSRRGYFDQHSPERTQNTPEHVDFVGNSQSQTSLGQSSIATCEFKESTRGPHDSNTLDLAVDGANVGRPSSSLMSLPSMVDTFEAMPEEMKSYLVYQLLRRCSKSVLHFVADIVNPALKCDFLRLLPVELCLNVLGNLDVKTLCRAAQVSKRWRHLVDSSETTWKRRFDADHYVLPEGELERAIREGWGWQFASHPSDSERNLGSLQSSLEAGVSIASITLYEGSLSETMNTSNSGSSTSRAKRSKRKAKSKTKPPNRKSASGGHDVHKNAAQIEEHGIIDIASADGPYAAAHLAARTVPNPHIGLRSLENLHLFKTIYMRSHIIRKTWMTDDVSPRHIAFRAHQRHVVTCLQFDAKRILTGSDDANINVYDTKTGALQTTLEGHDGGVWALQYEGNILVSGSTDRTVRVWDIDKGRCTQTFQGHTSTVRCLQILMPTAMGKTHDGRQILMPKQPLIITGSRDSNLRVWKLPKPGDPEFFQNGPAPDDSAECPYYVRTLAGHHHSVRAIAAHADTLVSGSYDCTVRVWKISTGETIHRLNGHSQKVYSVVLDTKRNRCISGSMDNLVKVWSLETGSALFNLEGHSSLVGLLDLQQDRLVSAAADSTLRIWDPENGHCRSILSAHTGAITCFQHDGQKVISGSDRTLKMWNVGTGEFARDLLVDLSGVWQVKFNERRCVAAVQRNNLTYIEVLDFGACRDGVPKHKRGKRIVVNVEGREVSDPHDSSVDVEITGDD